MKKIIIYSIILFFSENTFSQDNNYWMQMPGSRSALMGGAVVGGVRDNSAVFYNPGALGFIDSSSISVSANTYQYEMENIKNGGGAGVNLKSGQFQTVPLVSISGTIKPNKNSKHTFGFMLFTKNQTANNFSYRFDGNEDKSILTDDNYNVKSLLLNPNPYKYAPRARFVEYIGDYNLQTSLNELWAGATYAYQINKHISIGLSPFIAYRNQTLNESFVSRIIPNDTLSNFAGGCNNGHPINSISYDDIKNITFSNVRALGKIGISLDYGNLKFGAAFTTKSINLGGSTMISRDITYNDGWASDTTFNNTANFQSNVYNDRQQKLKTTYVSPFSASFGIDYRLCKTTIAFSGEYFGAVSAYNLATPQDHAFQRNLSITATGKPSRNLNSNQYLRIMEASQSVTNFAFAIEQQVSKKVSIVTSFRTDFTSYKKAANDFYESQFIDTIHPSAQRISFSNINLYHIALGAIIKNKKSDLHIGLSYSYGTNSSFQPFNNIASPNDNSSPLSPPYHNGNYLGAMPSYNQNAQGTPTGYNQNAIYKYASYSIILGYTFHLK